MRHKENNLIFEAYKTVCEGKYSPEELKKIAARSAPKDKLNKMDFVPIKEDDYEVGFEVGSDTPSEDEGEYDQEGEMAKDELETITMAADELSSILSDEENLPEWVQSKIILAKDYIDNARDYMLAQKGDSYPKTSQVAKQHGIGVVKNMRESVPLSDERAAKMIFDKIPVVKGVPPSMPSIKHYVKKYLDMVGKNPSDIDYLASLVFGHVEDMESKVEACSKNIFDDVD